MEVLASEITVPEMIDKALATYSPSDAAIAEMRANYMPLTVKDESDKDGHALVRAARLDVKEKRVAVEKCRVGLKEGALTYGQAVDAEARRLTGLLVPIEAHLQRQEDIVAKAAERRCIAEENARVETLRQRMAALREAGSPLIPEDVAAMTDDVFAAALADARKAKAERIESERLAAERYRIESERLAAERAELDRIQREQSAALAAQRAEQEAAAAQVRQQQEAEARKLAAERAAIEVERREQRHRVEVEAAEKRAAAQAIEDAKHEAERVAAEAARREAMRPVNEKLRVLAGHVEGLAVPEFDGAEEVRTILFNAAADIGRVVKRNGG